jgi:hypothetical protein
MDVSKLSDHRRNYRMNIRNFLLAATPAELETELELSLERKDEFRADVVRELMAEREAEAAR